MHMDAYIRMLAVNKNKWKFDTEVHYEVRGRRNSDNACY